MVKACVLFIGVAAFITGVKSTPKVTTNDITAINPELLIPSRASAHSHIWVVLIPYPFSDRA